MYFDWRLFRMTRVVRGRVVLAALLGLAGLPLGLWRLTLTGQVMARAIGGEAFDALLGSLGLIAGLIVIRALLQFARDDVANTTAAVMKARVRARLYAHVLDLGPGYFDARRSGDAALTLVEGVEQLDVFFGQYLPQLIVAGLTPLVIFAFMALLDLPTALVFLVCALFTLAAPAAFHRLNSTASLAFRRAQSALGADFLDSLQGLATLKAFGQSGRRGAALAEAARHLYRSTMWVLAVNIATGGITLLGISAGAAVALAWGALRVQAGELPLGTLLVVLLLGVEVFRPLRDLVQLYHGSMLAVAATRGMYDLLDSQPAVQSPLAPLALPSVAPRDVRFESVTFAYAPDRRPAVADCSFELHAGETLGVVGPSGAGKSTLVALLLRFVDPHGGRIVLGGRDIRALSLDELRAQVAVVAQDTYLFYGSVADNLRLARPDASQAELEAACRTANAHDFIETLPRGYQTPLGERGVRLSGGQRQRLAIARALLKDAPVLVLDEALSSVDAENEAMIQQALDRLRRGRTTLVIAHRLSSVVDADRIVVLEGGRLVETGTPSTLLARPDGVYARLMASQRTDGVRVSPEAASPADAASLADAASPADATGSGHATGSADAATAAAGEDGTAAPEGSLGGLTSPAGPAAGFFAGPAGRTRAVAADGPAEALDAKPPAVLGGGAAPGAALDAGLATAGLAAGEATGDAVDDELDGVSVAGQALGGPALARPVPTGPGSALPGGVGAPVGVGGSGSAQDRPDGGDDGRRAHARALSGLSGWSHARALPEVAGVSAGDSRRRAEGASDEPSATHLWWRLLRLVRPWWWETLIVLVLGPLQAGAQVALGVVSALLVGQVAVHADLRPWLWALAVLVPASAVLRWLDSWVSHDLAYRLLAELRIRLYRLLDPLAPAYLVRRRSGDLVSALLGDVELIELFYAHTISPLVVAILVPGAVLVLLIRLAPSLALILLPFLVAVALTPLLAGRQSARLGAELREVTGEVAAHAVDSVQGLRTIAAFGHGPARLAEIARHSRYLGRLKADFLRWQAVQNAVIEALMGLGALAVLTGGARLLASGELQRTLLPLATLLAASSFQPVVTIVTVAKELLQTAPAARRLFRIEDEPVPVRDGPGVPLAALAASGTVPSVGAAAPSGVPASGARMGEPPTDPVAPASSGARPAADGTPAAWLGPTESGPPASSGDDPAGACSDPRARAAASGAPGAPARGAAAAQGAETPDRAEAPAGDAGTPGLARVAARDAVAAVGTGRPHGLPVAFEGVCFAYGPGERPALEDVTFRIPIGGTVALVGRSGAGKTTAAHLLLRFWDPQAGRIRLGGHDLRAFRLDELRALVALVAQDTYLFNTSLRDNIRLGRPDASDDELLAAAQGANVDEFALALPSGYDTLVGERGVQLSGGQRQRVAIARALLKDAPVLVLDEATSHLDALSEAAVRRALDHLRAGRTTLVIAHRLSTIREADQIVVLDHGRLVEQGRHAELLAGEGLYAHLIHAQLWAASRPAAASVPSA